MSEQISTSDLVLEWYEKVRVRQVDLVGDYAGSELFLIDGDSLLLHCLDSDEIDFKDGFQLLHAVHCVELFLYGLVRRKCNFHIAFFDSHKDYGTSPGVLPENRFKYCLARTVVLRHLQINLPGIHPNIVINRYQSLRCPEFLSYLAASNPYFMMCHDGASSMWSPNLTKADSGTESVEKLKENGLQTTSDDNHFKETEPGNALSSVSNHRVFFRSAIFWFMRSGHNVVLINGLQFRDTKVMAMVLEGSRHLNRSLQAFSEDSISAEMVHNSPYNEGLVPSRRLLSQLDQKLESESDLILICILRDMLSRGQERSDMALAMIISAALRYKLPISRRRLRHCVGTPCSKTFLRDFATAASCLLEHSEWTSLMHEDSINCDVADMLDGRLFNEVLQKLQSASDRPEIHPAVQARVDTLLEALAAADGCVLESKFSQHMSAPSDTKSANMEFTSMSKANSHPLLPFSHAIFDGHLASVQVCVDQLSINGSGESQRRIFEELTHWHNRRPLQRKRVTDDRSEWMQKRAMRSNQRFQAEIRDYAKSLTGTNPEPEVIIVEKGLSSDLRKGKQNVPMEKAASRKAISAKSVLSKADMIKAANKASKADQHEDKVSRTWQTQIILLKAETAQNKVIKAAAFLRDLQSDQKKIIGGEVLMYQLSSLLDIWIKSCRNPGSLRPWGVAALMWDIVKDLSTVETPLSSVMFDKLDLTCRNLGFPRPTMRALRQDRKPSFDFVLSGPVDESFRVSKQMTEFQLLHCGPYMERSIDSVHDSRVRFDPDHWQRKVLDMIDDDKSIFVVAPTSAGKTFISFYAMKRVLQSSDEGVLVYVAPTKALVNQIAAELQAAFRKNYDHAGKSVWAIHTRDYRVNNPTGCQILVTVPHVLQIMLLSPSNARTWAPRVKRIIFDEIHSIGQAEDGRVWEQLLLFAPCPIIALSATVGNPNEFNEWLVSTQRSHGVDLQLIKHPHRYSDLRKFVYSSPKIFTFTGLGNIDSFGVLGLDDATGFYFMHPVASLGKESKKLPEDLHLEPRDCLTLFECMKRHATKRYPIDPRLEPPSQLPSTIKKVDIFQWEKRLKEVLELWMVDQDSPFRFVLEELSKPLFLEDQEDLATTNIVTEASNQGQSVDEDSLLDTTLPLVTELHAQGALPAILFNYDRSMCEKICRTLVEQLKSLEAQWKASSGRWKKKVSEWEQYKKELEKQKSRKVNTKAKKRSPDGVEDEKTSKVDLERDNTNGDSSALSGFDPEAPVDSLHFGLSFHFANTKALLPSELAEHMDRLRWRRVPDWLCEALTRGIAVHHAGLNRSYRQVVETLFRAGYLRVVIATGTLALGINMPCKTVVFSGDSIFLTALNFRQAAGRAGRRGFDLLGNVVFQNMSVDKARRLVSSRLPDLNGHFPITTTLILRLFTLLHGSKESPYAKRLIDSLLSQPRLFLGGQSFKEQVLHHLRFSIEYLRRQFLLDVDGTPLNFAGCVSHLYFTENSSFAFHALLKDGYFHSLCADFSPENELRILETLMLVLAHLFGRRFCRQADQEFVDKIVKNSPSVVFLPPLPRKAEAILHEHNTEILGIFATYAATFASQHLKQDDRKLPLTEMNIGVEKMSEADGFLESLPPTVVRSAFTALSGHDDSFTSISELCRTARDGIFLEESVVPHVTLHPEETGTALNAYLYDFYKHGSVQALATANGIRRGDVWFLLNDFSLVLATIVTSFRNYMGISDGTDPDLLDIKGGGDAYEEELDEAIANQREESNSPSEILTSAEHIKIQNKTTTKKKEKVVEDWQESVPDAPLDEDDLSNDDLSSSTSDNLRNKNTSGKPPVWGNGSQQDLLKVLKAFQRLKVLFDEKFLKMWA